MGRALARGRPGGPVLRREGLLATLAERCGEDAVLARRESRFVEGDPSELDALHEDVIIEWALQHNAHADPGHTGCQDEVFARLGPAGPGGTRPFAMRISTSFGLTPREDGFLRDLEAAGFELGAPSRLPVWLP